MPKFNLYSAWMDPVFYLWGAAFAAALFALVYSIRRALELKNKDVFEEEELPADEAENPFVVSDVPAEQPELLPKSVPVPAAAPVRAQPEAAPKAAYAAAESAPSGNRAETFVRGIYEGISGLEARLKGIEAQLTKGRAGNDFTVKFLEDILQDIETLDKAKIKARIEYLVSDLKK
jgi:hypothetical protein